jgi:hypothetical protein
LLGEKKMLEKIAVIKTRHCAVWLQDLSYFTVLKPLIEMKLVLLNSAHIHHGAGGTHQNVI